MPDRSILRLILGIAGVVVILAGMRAAAQIVNLVLISVLFTMLFVPLLFWLQKKGMKGWMALMTVLLLFVVAGVGLLALLGITAAEMAKNLDANKEQISQQISQVQQQLESRGIDAQTITSAAETVGKQVLEFAASAASNFSSLIVNGAFVLLIVGYMLAEASSFVERMQRSVDQDSMAFRKASQAVPSVVRFIAITAVFNLIIATGDIILLWFLGIPYPLLWGVFAFVFGFIPYIGYWISVLPPMILGFAQSGIEGALFVLIGYWFINGILSSVVAPRFYGKGLNVSPVLVLLAVLFWGWLLGPIGAVVGVPMTVLLKSIVLENYDATKWLAAAASQNVEESEPESP